jgi:hypothetical protein
MPCNCNYMNPNDFEIEASKAAAFLDEIKTGKLKNKYLSGYHPKFYGKSISQGEIDDLTAKLCKKCSEIDVTKFSLELQMWWRDHQEADKKRLKKEMKKAREKNEIKKALSKLDPHEVELIKKHEL